MTIYFKSSFGAGSAEYIQSRAEETGGDAAAAFSFYRAFGKRVFDVLFVLATAPVAVVMVAVAAALMALDGQNPFFWQKRIGRNGREFRLLKIRTMVPDAEAKLDAHLRADPAARLEWDSKQKLDDDPRITRFGAVLRKSSLDELPQLWNVLMGDMSIVGPRPMMVDQQPLYPGRAYYRLSPGITGNWQISDRSEGSFAGRVVFDNDYEAKLSLAIDMDILVRTIGVVLRCTGR